MNLQTTKRRVLKSGILRGAWFDHTAPDGSTSTVRIVQMVEVFEADYYGRGTHRFVRGFDRMQSRDGSMGPVYRSWDDGHEKEVALWEKALDAARVRMMSERDRALEAEYEASLTTENMN